MKPVHTITVERFNAGAKDAHGNPTVGYLAPESVLVYGWAPTHSYEVTPGRAEVSTDLTVYGPPDFTLDSRDRVTIDGEVYEAHGEVGDFTKGPFGTRFGVVVQVRRVEG